MTGTVHRLVVAVQIPFQAQTLFDFPYRRLLDSDSARIGIADSVVFVVFEVE